MSVPAPEYADSKYADSVTGFTIDVTGGPWALHLTSKGP
jgi:hypothetical protein